MTGTGGLGFQDALALAAAGAEVILAGRNPNKGHDAVAKIRAAVPNANATFEHMDLASLASIRAFGARMRAQRESLDVLINNAAVMTPPRRQVTTDGFELQLGTNHLGHFLLTSELLPLLKKARGSRVVTVSSIAARDGNIEFDDLQGERNYNPPQLYSQSKLANLLFAFELQRRSEAGRWGVASIAAHPGVSRTDLVVNGAGWFSLYGLMRFFFARILFQPAAQGALPTLYAATCPDATHVLDRIADGVPGKRCVFDRRTDQSHGIAVADRGSTFQPRREARADGVPSSRCRRGPPERCAGRRRICRATTSTAEPLLPEREVRHDFGDGMRGGRDAAIRIVP